MAKLIYGMLTSLDGFVEDEEGRFGWSAPESEQVHSYVNELTASVGTYLYGRRMYDTMVYWETAHEVPNQPQFVLDWANQWQVADKVVYSRTLGEPRSARTTIERDFDPEAIRRLKAESRHDITIDGPELASLALKAGLVDEIQQTISAVVVGGGKRFFPAGVKLPLELLESRAFDKGVVALRYAVKHGNER